MNTSFCLSTKSAVKLNKVSTTSANGNVNKVFLHLCIKRSLGEVRKSTRMEETPLPKSVNFEHIDKLEPQNLTVITMS